MQWRTNVSGTCLERQQYRFSYDYANRLTAANHWTHNGTVWTNTNNYSESNITFDLNGNIKTYTRRGLVTAPGTYGVIDQLTYTYGDAARPDRLTNMVDARSITKGFKYTAGAAAYAYDANGNMTQDNHKGFTFGFNFLNLPQSLTQGSNVITMTYTADGEKLSKAVTGGGATKNYVGGIEYAGANLEAIYFGEGRCTPNGATAFNYDYTVKDHLGSARVNFRANGAAITVLESMHYYPFGMLMEGIGTNTPTNDYTYNYKELNEDFGLNLYDYGARWYDASLGRWWSVDPMAEKYGRWSGYNYGLCNPVRFIDPDGMALDDIIIKAKRNDETNYSQNTLMQLQSLSDDVLGFAPDGKTVEIKEQCSGETTEATKLIRDLASSDKNTLITNNIEGKSINNIKLTDDFLESQATTEANDGQKAANGEGTGSTIFYSPEVKAKFNTIEGNREIASADIILAHELIHADNNRTGKREVGKRIEDHRYNKEEEKTIQRENIIREQRNQKKRYDGSR